MTMTPKQFKVVVLRETATETKIGDTPEMIADYFRNSIVTDPHHDNDREQLYVILLNSRRRIMGHVLVSTGLLDTILAHPRETYRAAIVANASAIVVIHNHPSGDPAPSEPDVKVTRELIKAG